MKKDVKELTHDHLDAMFQVGNVNQQGKKFLKGTENGN